MILGFKPINTYFQSPKHVIKACDSRLIRIDVLVEGLSPPLVGTLEVQLSAQHVAHLIQTEKEKIPLEEEEETIFEGLADEDLERDFELFPNHIFFKIQKCMQNLLHLHKWVPTKRP